MKVKLLLLFILICQFSHSQELKIDSIYTRPKIGLVLSGGGAKGFAHIGVLKAIEKAGLKIDYIGGTSMGAAVGALYATGYTANQIDSIITSIDFMEMLSDKIDRKYASFFDKKHGEKYLLNLPIKNGKVGLPLALSKGQSTYNKLSELYYPVAHINDFSKLPIPFFCMTTNIENGKGIEINSGSLPEAIRSSASLPTLLSPNKLDSITTVIDGGIADNFPIDVMKKKGVDIIIGVDVQGVLQKPENIDSALKVIDQIINYQLYGEEHNKTDDIDIYIHPDVFSYGMVDFDKTKQIIIEGEKAGNKFIDVFKKLAKRQNLPTETKIALKTDRRKYTINQINISGADNYTRRYLRGKLNIKPNEKISNVELSNRINYLTQTKNFNSIRYSFDKQDSIVDLNFKIDENPQSLYLRVGAHYDTTYKLSGLINVTDKHLFLRNDLLSLDLAFGDNIRAELNYFVDNGQFLSYGFNSIFNQLETNMNFEGDNSTSIDYEFSNVFNYLYSQINFRNRFAISLGLEHQFIRTYTRTFIRDPNDDRTYFDKSHYFNFLAKAELDTYDKKSFPNNGYLIKSTFRTYLSSSDYNENFAPISQARILLEGIKTISNTVSLFLQADSGISITNDNQENLNYGIGGYGNNFINNYVPFHGYTFSELIGNSYIKGAASIRYRFYKKNYVDFYANYAIVTDDVIDFLKHEPFFKNAKTGYSIGYSADSILGPIDIRYAWSPENRNDAIYISVGFWF
ncbi:patatin-like phospholipase family protein [Wenyingzhuangia sp. chi5]|uniref:Patatin-like phospholipase family protein n=1 Tax=Wenyingzhuangia gilva TaxID=3057677 RepID=A0ABT8VQ45_9FLAO|nr:patatin-like phospholipase family protein [Wenyingzhuangia sp. chi5]MDO3694067.1 patatin-like phospholipase family protein [Wenyingzhuangia sp. chi5]